MIRIKRYINYGCREMEESPVVRVASVRLAHSGRLERCNRLISYDRLEVKY
jgi:hypothetical protein